jgi:hypothetical protein
LPGFEGFGFEIPEQAGDGSDLFASSAFGGG